ncbi:hypothetical protein IV498_16235 [Paenarthrobacter sp. Z7-10]|uniref:hypothetical protein n=1 Tax=Paenarthrobacter sp. Z7-10 TaxID=2787635 RepID=UPI0022A98722|nr:hypothetical protein [Paenarthrobacter sp. Z7-10]MCZ2404684.1 hypothetical protein [Paenarthrobacter sp. Z7-10]
MPATRRQALEIIQTVLNDPAPEREEIRARLRRHVATDPGHPELALLKHLLERAPMNNQPSWTAVSGMTGEDFMGTSEPGGSWD